MSMKAKNNVILLLASNTRVWNFNNYFYACLEYYFIFGLLRIKLFSNFANKKLFSLPPNFSGRPKKKKKNHNKRP